LSIPILGLAAWISGERITHIPSPLSLSLLAYQSFWVVGLTFLLWFALVKTYSASKLSAFTFITPLFGVAASYFIMHDTLDDCLWFCGAAGDRRALSRQKAGFEGRAGSERAGVNNTPSFRWRRLLARALMCNCTS